MRLPHKTTFDTLSNRLECHKVACLPRKITLQPAWKPSKRKGFAASPIDTARASVNFERISQNATPATEFEPCRHLTQNVSQDGGHARVACSIQCRGTRRGTVEASASRKRRNHHALDVATTFVCSLPSSSWETAESSEAA